MYIVIVEAADPDYAGWQPQLAGPFRSIERAMKIAEQLQSEMDNYEHMGTWFAQVHRVDPVNRVLSEIRDYVEEQA